jgi:IMP and pyridine-specific 5'-nucleotidase
VLIRSEVQHQGSAQSRSKLSMLVPTVGKFFTPLALEEAFLHQDRIRAISSRRFVPPSFNDIRLILNTSQIISLIRPPPSPSNPHSEPSLRLLTFDGDVTLYKDGGSLVPNSPVIPRLVHFLSLDVKIAIITAAGYTEPAKYYSRLSGLLDAVRSSSKLTNSQKSNLMIMGGESNFLLVFSSTSPDCLKYINRRDWILPVMSSWSEKAIQSLLDIAESAFESCITALRLPAKILRKSRAVGIFPNPDCKLTREQLEETVLVVQHTLDTSPKVAEANIPFCAFNGGSDVFVDIGDKSLGVQGCQKWFGGIAPGETLHVGDQFLSGGGNDFKARGACATAWVASPGETVTLLDEMLEMQGKKGELQQE